MEAETDGDRASDADLLAAARRGDEAAAARLTERHGGALKRYALGYTRDGALAEDAVQDAWLAFLRGMDRFEARASVRTWLFAILRNRLKARLERDRRLVSFTDLAAEEIAAHETAVPEDRFLDATHEKWPHHWKTPPRNWGENPESLLMAREARHLIDAALQTLPAAQREVITLRDIEGWTGPEVCELLQLSESNQRVLLHRARSKIRLALEEHFMKGDL